MGSSSLVKSRKSYHTFCFPPVFGSCNSKMLLVKSWDRIHFEKFMIIKVARKTFYYHIPFLLTMFSQNVPSDVFCNNSLMTKLYNLTDSTIEKLFFFHVSFELVLKREIKNILYYIIHEKKYSFIIFHVRYTQ